jgi:hypothetical protein
MAGAAPEGVEWMELVVSALLVVAFLDDEGGLQFRKEVQILQGLPSGPRTIPGGRVGAGVLLLLMVR